MADRIKRSPTVRAAAAAAAAAAATAAALEPDAMNYVLKLYVTGMTPRSTQALATIKTICNEHLHGRYDLEVIDIYQHPQRASEDQIIAAPTLVKRLPAPLRRFIGDLSDIDHVLVGLGVGRKP